jgi:hypothetical protein
MPAGTAAARPFAALGGRKKTEAADGFLRGLRSFHAAERATRRCHMSQNVAPAAIARNGIVP